MDIGPVSSPNPTQPLFEILRFHGDAEHFSVSCHHQGELETEILFASKMAKLRFSEGFVPQMPGSADLPER